jgi:ABC-2 type transport system permease protein
VSVAQSPLATKFNAMMVVARRDFVTVVFSKTFILFLLGPLFMVVIGVAAGGIGHATDNADQPVIGVAMTATDAKAMQGARDVLSDYMGGAMPDFVALKTLAPGEPFNATEAMHGKIAKAGTQLAAVLTGTPARPVLTATPGRLDEWQGMIALVAQRALSPNAAPLPKVRTEIVATSAATKSSGQIATGQAGQTLLFLLTMLLATMVLSNLVEEKSNKIIEILAAAIPMDALFLGKLFAMLAVSFLGIAVWGSAGLALVMMGAKSLPVLPTPAVGWGLFIALGVLYFAMAYLLLGSVYLAIGGMAATVRDIQTMAMPASLLQIAIWLFASYALARHGQPIEMAAMAFPLSSPYTMLARAAMDGAIWPHVVALAWQALWVLAFITMGATLFRKTVMKSGGARGKASRRGWFAKAA